MKPRVLITHASDGWDVRVTGLQQPVAHAKTQEHAIGYGKPIAQMMQTELTIQGRDGKFREGWSYGNDPRKIKG
jgi:hypothetical protein